jgi:hypothetical protein
MVCIFLLLFIYHASKAQITLLPANTTFLILAIELYPVDDYTGSKQYIGLFGNKDRIDVLWNAKYNLEALDPINVTCWLNCKNKTDITRCYGLQNCSYQGLTGPASCTIFNPSYDYFSINNITCRFFDPSKPELEYKLLDGTYPQRVFYLIRYSVSVSGGIYQVGRAIDLPITFVSYSFLNSNYTGLAYVQQQSFIAIDNTYNTTNILRYSQIDTVHPKITVIYASGRSILYINTTANELSSCNSINDCPDIAIATQGYQKSCIDRKCWYVFTTEIGSAYLSLPEYSIKDLILILIISTIIFILILRKHY